MSDGDTADICGQMEAAMRARSPVISQNYYVCCDIDGAVATAFQKGILYFLRTTNSPKNIFNIMSLII